MYRAATKDRITATIAMVFRGSLLRVTFTSGRASDLVLLRFEDLSNLTLLVASFLVRFW